MEEKAIPEGVLLPEEPKDLAVNANVAHSDIDVDIFNPSGACEHNPYEPKSVGSDEDNTWDFGILDENCQMSHNHEEDEKEEEGHSSPESFEIVSSEENFETI
ncbi:hypothetical protein TNCT_502381 [Trichonephila clavata]|uniref:Uncharacterized protein n=1 Tax=Trichonephila clavata TaxID=2740835 RepID=A0A8X6KB07_TRICU|nr:hypothetical protein TNCT_502381 [Trichonephila clavata]